MFSSWQGGVRLGRLSSTKLARLASSCNVVDVGFMVFNEGVVASKKSVPMITVQRIRECLGEIFVKERLNTVSQDEYICFRSTQWLNRIKLALEYCKIQ